ncbi:MAG: sugar ABC transporter permease [Lachnospiraceae bacterium]|nr:sugar ABC transporter permease [Lachnospiraceae bacterium]
MSKPEEKKKSKSKVEINRKILYRQRVLIIISIIFVAYGLLFYYVPLGGWIMAFQNYKPKDGLLHSTFVGLDKFKFLFSDATFLRVIRNTFCMGLLNLIFPTTLFPIAFAVLLNEMRSLGGKRVVQTISYLPHFLSWIIVTGILHDSLSNSGIVNELLLKFHIIKDPIGFFSTPKLFWGIVCFAHLWKEMGWNAIIYLSAISSIDPNLYEAAAIDGAGRWGKIWYVTLPSLRPTIIVLLLMNMGFILNAGFEVQYLLGNGLVKNVSDTIDIYVLTWGVSQNDYSLGTAAGIFKSVVSIVIIMIANAIAKKTGEGRLF